MNLHWLDPWVPVLKPGGAFEAELQRELGPGHELFDVPVTALGFRGDCDDVLYQFLDGTNRVAVVHLTWRGSRESDPAWPHTVIFDNMDGWVERCMVPDHRGSEFNEDTD